jgi:hypothetical protein
MGSAVAKPSPELGTEPEAVTPSEAMASVEAAFPERLTTDALDVETSADAVTVQGDSRLPGVR